jgi:hypothetical protein
MKNSLAGNPFPPCTPAATLLEPMPEAALFAALHGEYGWLSDAASAYVLIRNNSKKALSYCHSMESISWGARFATPNMPGEISGSVNHHSHKATQSDFSQRFF